MKVSAVSVPDAASDAAHPDHDRWVKERTLKMEIDHAKAVGLPLRHAEAENARLLERAEQIAKGTKPGLTKKKDKPGTNAGHGQRTKKRGVTVRAAGPVVTGMQESPCGRCGTCIRCKREKRVFAMWQRAREQGDLKMQTALLQLGFYAQQARDGTGRFVGINPADANRMVIRRLEEVCDATIPMMGPWR